MTSTTQPRAGTASFSPELFTFLAELRANNDRDWFKANKRRYEDWVQEPALEFVADFAPILAEISPHFVADPRPVGGSLFRIYRDTRFSKDKSPYKTHTGIHFRHEAGRYVHAPGFYLHLEPGQVFAGAGIWHPDGETLGRIRNAIVDDPDHWVRTTRDRTFASVFELGGDSLKRAPAGYDAGHRLIADLRRKDFVASTALDEKAVTSRGFAAALGATFAAAGPFVRFLCDATGVPF